MRIMKFLVVLVFVAGTYAAYQQGDVCAPGDFDENTNDCMTCDGNPENGYSWEFEDAGTHCGTPVQDVDASWIQPGRCEGGVQRCGPPSITEADGFGIDRTCSRVSGVESTIAPTFESGSMKVGGGIQMVFGIPCIFSGNWGTAKWHTHGSANANHVAGTALGPGRSCVHDDNCNEGAYCAKTCEITAGCDGGIAFGTAGTPGFCGEASGCTASTAVSGVCGQGSTPMAAIEIVHTENWGDLQVAANADGLIRDTPDVQEVHVVTDFWGQTSFQWDFTLGKELNIQRDVYETFAMKFTFIKTVSVSATITQSYAVIVTQAQLITTRARKAAAATSLVIDFVIETYVNAPFVLNYGQADDTTMADDDDAALFVDTLTSYHALDDVTGTLPLTFVEEIIGGGGAAADRDSRCNGPYATSYTVGSTTLGDDKCRQEFHFQTTLNLVNNCRINGGLIRFKDDDGVDCGIDGAYDCPMTDQQDYFNFEIGVDTANACTTFAMETSVCAYMEIRQEDGTKSTGFAMGDVYQINSYIGVASSDQDQGEASSLGTYVTGVVSNDILISPAADGMCIAGSCEPAFGGVFATGACALDSIDLSADTDAIQKTFADDNACPDHLYDCLQTAQDRFDSPNYDLAVATGDTVSIAFSSALVATTNGNLAKKSRVSVSTKEQFWALLQTEETAELRSETVAGLSAIPAEAEVEVGAADPEIAPAQEVPELTETSSNLVYIVVGVLLVLSIAIAAVVMYMRRVKGAKKVQPVVPLPITIETTSASSTA